MKTYTQNVSIHQYFGGEGKEVANFYLIFKNMLEISTYMLIIRE